MRRVNLFFGTVLLLLWIQFRETGLPGLSAELDLSTGVPARVYLFKEGRPFRLSPVDALLPLPPPSEFSDELLREHTRRVWGGHSYDEAGSVTSTEY